MNGKEPQSTFLYFLLIEKILVSFVEKSLIPENIGYSSDEI